MRKALAGAVMGSSHLINPNHLSSDMANRATVKTLQVGKHVGNCLDAQQGGKPYCWGYSDWFDHNYLMIITLAT